MNAQDLRKVLQKSNNKLTIFSSLETLNRYNFNEQEMFDLIRDFLNDAEKLKLFSYPHFQGFETWIIKAFSDENIKFRMLSRKDLIVNRLHLLDSQIAELIKDLSSDNAKNEILGIYRIRRRFID